MTCRKYKIILIMKDDTNTCCMFTTKYPHKIQTLCDQKQRLSARVAQFDFKYTRPSRDFDDRKVKDTVVSLVSVKENKHMCALEIIVQSKLRQVVVDDAQTSKDLIKHGKLKRRVTISPR